MGKRILVAEDNPALALVVRLHLEHVGFHVTVARNGREAWNYLQKQDYDLLVTDQQMPEMSGVELCLQVRQSPRTSGLPVVMLTAKGLELERARLSKELGVLDVVPKPFSPRHLVDIVENCLTAAASS